MTVEWLVGDCRETLKTLPSDSVHSVVTSPPYWSLRDHDDPAQIGAEMDPDDYVDDLVRVFREVRRVLRPDGTLWLNLGDMYSKTRDGRVKEGDLMGMPWRVAFALRADGWWLRQENIWAKRNIMPEAVKDRTSRSHEQVFMLTRSREYFYDVVATMEPGVIPAGTRGAKASVERSSQRKVNSRPPEYHTYTGQRRKRSVWFETTVPFPGPHFSVMSHHIARICLEAGTSEGGCCVACGTPYIRQVEKTAAGVQTIGWNPGCDCGWPDPYPCTVLDPFGGVGTTALAAEQLGRNAILCELIPENVRLGQDRIARDAEKRS